MVVKRLKKFLTGQTGAIKDTTRRSGGGKYLQYPINRTQAESEDSLLIKAMEYMPPSSTLTNRDGTGKDDLSDLSKTPIGSGLHTTYNTVGVVRNKKTKEIIRVNKELNFVNPGGMDARINASSTSDPGGFKEKIKYYV